MKCWRFDIRRDFSRYVTGELPAVRTARLEDHLLDCGECRVILARMKRGNSYAKSAPPAVLKRDPWSMIERGILSDDGAPSESHLPASKRHGIWRRLPARPKIMGTMAVLVIVMTAVGLFVYSRPGNSNFGASIDADEFFPVSIAEIERSTQAHVVAEGYVAEVKLNDEGGDICFKLVEGLEAPTPFVICEIIDPLWLEPPAVGSRVRVYGVSRYDNRADHNWYEVHPVLSIEPLAR